MTQRTEAAVYVHAGDADPTLRFGSRTAEAIKRAYPLGGLIPAHQLAGVLRAAGE